MTIRGSRRPHVVPISAPSFPVLPRSNIYRNIAYTFLGLTVIVVFSVLWLSSVRAKVTVIAKQESVQLDGTVEVAREVKSGQIPGRVLQSVFTQTQDFDVPATTSTAMVPTVPAAPLSPAPLPASAAPAPIASDTTAVAQGMVRIVNHYSRAQTLVKTTRLLTPDQKLYRIERTIHVLPNQEVTVMAHADQPGSAYAIGPARLTIPGLFIDLQKYIYAVSDNGFTLPGGSAVSSTTPVLIHPSRSTTSPALQAPSSSQGEGKVEAHVVTQDMVDQAYAALTQQIIDQAKKMFATQVNDPRLSEVVVFAQPTDTPSASVSPGDQAAHFRATVKLNVMAVYYPKADMLALIQARLKEKIPDGRQFLPLDERAVRYSLESADPRSETATIHVIAQGDYRLSGDSPSLQKEFIAAKSVTDAQNMLRAIPGVQDVQIRLSPSWMGKIPSLKDHIDITVQ